MNRLNEALVILMEEASEVAQAASKCIRFSEDKDYERLEEEIGDFMCLYEILVDMELIDPAKVAMRVPVKREKLKKWSRLLEE
jgi:NTP pyrophosphatase (non-canonical NTP hydrolase)